MVDLANQSEYSGLKQLEGDLAIEKENLAVITASWEALI
jgi:hypothetical protein